MLVLDGCNAKLRRAEEHLEAIRNEIQTWHKSHPYDFRWQKNPEQTRHSVVARFNTPPPVERLKLLAGDCAHGLRSALDHLVYAIAVHQAGLDPPPHERRLQFPIADTAKAFCDQQWRIKSLSDAVQAEIESLQPYNRPHAQLPPLLSMLREFDDADKHRLLNVIVSAQFESTLRNLNYPIAPGESIEVVQREDGIEDGTETFAVITQRPAPDLRYDLAVKLGLGIRHGRGPEGADHSEVSILLAYIRDEVRLVVERVSQRA